MLGHINNLYNTTFWAIVHSGKTETQAEEELRVRREREMGWGQSSLVTDAFEIPGHIFQRQA